jgi:hypothetical protein
MTKCEICGKSACAGCAEFRKQTTEALDMALGAILNACQQAEDGELSYGKAFSRIMEIIEATGEA